MVCRGGVCVFPTQTVDELERIIASFRLVCRNGLDRSVQLSR